MKKRQASAKEYCRSIVGLMLPTEVGRKTNSVLVCITADLWKRIYRNARKGSRTKEAV